MHLKNQNFIIFVTFLETYKYRMFSFKLINDFAIH